MLVSKNAKTLRYPKRNPNESQWNIGCVGSQTQSSGVGHVHFMFFVLISFAFGSQRKPRIQWNMGLNPEIVSVVMTSNRFIKYVPKISEL